MEDDGLFRLQRLLSKKNNHKVFRSLQEGLKPDEQALKRLGLGKRAFYYSIRELRQGGLAAKREGKSWLGLYISKWHLWCKHCFKNTFYSR